MSPAHRHKQSRAANLKARRVRRLRQPEPTLLEMLAQYPTYIEMPDEVRARDLVPSVGVERFWEPGQQRLSLAKRIALRRLLLKKRWRR